MNEGKIDFSSLDPSRNEEAWERRISNIVAAASDRRQPVVSIWLQLAAWAKPPLIASGIAAALFLAVSGVVVRREERSAVSSQQEPALALSGWAAGEDLPSTHRILQILGGSYDEK